MIIFNLAQKQGTGRVGSSKRGVILYWNLKPGSPETSQGSSMRHPASQVFEPNLNPKALDPKPKVIIPINPKP